MGKRIRLVLVLVIASVLIGGVLGLASLVSNPVPVNVAEPLSIANSTQSVNTFAGSRFNLTWTVNNAANGPISASARLSMNLTGTVTIYGGTPSVFQPGPNTLTTGVLVSGNVTAGHYAVSLEIQR